MGAIDVNGINSKPNKIVECVNPDDTSHMLTQVGSDEFILNDNLQLCTVDNSSIGDIFPIIFYDSTVIPATNAAAYVLNTAK